MREKYKRLYYRKNKEEAIISEEPSKEQIKETEACIEKVKEIVKEIKEIPTIKEKIKIINNTLLKEIKKIEEYQLTIEQAEQLNNLLNTKELQILNSRAKNKAKDLNKSKQKIRKKLAEAIDIKQYQTENLEELKNLERKITPEMEKENPISIGTVKNRINSKISAIKQQEAKEKIKNDIPENILEIIKDLVKGTADIEKAKKTIEEEAKTKINSKPRNKITLTEEQEKRQILIKIRTIIRDRAEEFQISNPETTIQQLQELDKGDLRQAINIVTENLIASKKFNEAKRICDKFSKEDKENSIIIKELRAKVRNAEISDIILKGLNMQK